jgi:enediyne biosynthesis protein E4
MIHTFKKSVTKNSVAWSLLRFVCLGIILCGAGCTRLPTGDATSGVASTSPTPLSPLFKEVTLASGISYQWSIAGSRPCNILQTIGNGAALFDYNNDDNLDILLVGPKLALYQGDGKGKFTDVSNAVGIATMSGNFLGCAVGDYDNDGFLDVYITGYQDGRLLHNNAGKTLEDRTKIAGLPPQPWGTVATFVETTKGSGRLDLIVGNYATFGPNTKQLCETRNLEGKIVQTSCGPRDYVPVKSRLYRNIGQGVFRDDSRNMGFNTTTGRTLGIAAIPSEDPNNLSPTIFLANDETASDLMRLEREKNKFVNQGVMSNIAYDRSGNVHGGMGISWGDYDNDGKFDAIVGTFQNEVKSLYRSEEAGAFTDVAYKVGIGIPSSPVLTFGIRFFDYDNDGFLDIILANGHVQDNIHEIDATTTYRQAAQLFHHRGKVAADQPLFEEVGKSSPDLVKPIVGRGLAVGDYDNDGRVDILLVDSEGSPLLLHNEGKTSGHWLGLHLVGKKSNRSGLGALITATLSDGTKRVRHCHTDGSYMSASDVRVHLGLGTTSVTDLTIRWPSGTLQKLQNPTLDRYNKIEEN